MKKNKIIIIFIALVISAIGIITLNSIKKESKKDNGKININEVSNEELEKRVVHQSKLVQDKLLSDDFKFLAMKSDSLVKGKTLSINYEAIEGNAWTKLKFQVEEDFKGQIKSGEIIDVYLIGGYITLEDHISYFNDADKFNVTSDNEIKNKLIKETVGEETEFIKKGESLILCLMKVSEDTPLPKGAYEKLYSSGMLKLEGNTYKQKYGEVEEKYSINVNELSSIKKIITK